MNTTKDLGRREAGAVAQRPDAEHFLRPAVDILEDEGGITLYADMPGVPRDGLDVVVEGDTLSIEGRADFRLPEGMQALYADVRSTRYQRSFSLSRELEGDKIAATLKDGVLSLRIPKLEEHKPRKIDVRVD